jgi:hypothetical protein
VTLSLTPGRSRATGTLAAFPLRDDEEPQPAILANGRLSQGPSTLASRRQTAPSGVEQQSPPCPRHGLRAPCVRCRAGILASAPAVSDCRKPCTASASVDRLARPQLALARRPDVASAESPRRGNGTRAPTTRSSHELNVASHAVRCRCRTHAVTNCAGLPGSREHECGSRPARRCRISKGIVVRRSGRTSSGSHPEDGAPQSPQPGLARGEPRAR